MGFYSIVFAFLLSLIAIILMIIFIELEAEKYYIVISPFVTVFLTSFGYFIHKLDKGRPKILIEKEIWESSQEIVENFFNLLDDQNDKSNIWIINKTGIHDFGDDFLIDENKYLYVNITNSSKSSDLNLKIRTRTHDKRKTLAKRATKLDPEKKFVLFIDLNLKTKMNYFNVEKYGRSDNYEFF